MASRMETLQLAIEAAYVGAPDTTWHFGARHIYRHDNWNRIVMWPGAGPVGTPTTAAQGQPTTQHDPLGGIDDLVWERSPQMSIGIWAEDVEQAEHRLHSLLVAIDDVISQADHVISNLNETWVEAETQDLTSAGATVVLTFNVVFNVYAKDTDITAFDAATSPTPPRPTVGEGGPTEVVTQVTVITPDEPDIPDDVIT